MRRPLVLAVLLATAVSPTTAAAHGHRRHHRRVHHEAPVAWTIPTHPVVTTAPPPAPPPSPPPPKQLGHLQVVAREFSLTASRSSVAAGPVAVELDNLGQDPHDLRVERVDDPATGFSFSVAKPGAVSSQKLDLGPGTWKLYCTLPGHDALGMHAFVTVAG